MNDPVPDHRNRFAVIVGRVLHPYFLPIPVVLAILDGLPVGEAVEWTLVVISIILLPGMTYATYLQRQGRALYKRQTRNSLYLVGWSSILVCLGVTLYFHAPLVLIAAVSTLAVWVPLQWAINRWITKISAHAAVAAGCYTALLILGKLETLPLQIALFALVIITLWARVITRNHTIPQVILGVLVGVLPVLLVFPLVLA
jgi:hypothetical protein